MVVSDDALLFIGVLLFNLILFQMKKDFYKKMLGHFMMILVGISAYFFLAVDKPWGIIITVLGIALLLLEMFR